MKKHNSLFTFLTSIIFFVGFHCSPKKSNNPYAKLNKTHKVSSIENSQISTHSWENRVFNLNETYADYIKQLNQIDGLEEVPKPLEEQEFRKAQNEFFKIAQEEPLVLKNLKNKYIHWIYLCNNLGSTGISGFIQKENHFIGGFIILDLGLLKNANDWISYKENTVFALKELSLKIQIDKENSLSHGIDYILLHELGHIVSVVEGYVPDFISEYRDFQSASFTKYDWLEETKSIHDAKIYKRSEIRFYSKPTLTDLDIFSVYSSLEQTPFPTLYSATNADDHFAESFVSYIHIYIKNKPWLLKIQKDNQTIYETNNGITSLRCKREREFMENFFKNY